MTSELQSETSRRNGAKSRGPKTDPGKSISSRNSTTHGMLSKTIVIDGEVPARFAALLASIRADLQPRNTIEDGFMEDLAICRWRQRRLLTMETACITQELRRQEPQTASDPPPARAAQAFANLATLRLISSQEHRYDRQYTRILSRFHAFRKEQKQ
jgi:hypothetical protein